MQIQNHAAFDMFRKFFGGSGESIPDELNRFVKYYKERLQNDELYLPPVPLEVKQQNSKLTVRIVFHSITFATVLLLEELPLSISNALVRARLTEREATILFWISQGKTDGDIGRLLQISIRTVQKHVEHIFDKLGVETRTAAMARFLET